MNREAAISHNTRIDAHATVDFMERMMLKIWTSPKYTHREDIDTVHGISGDALAQLKAAS